MTQIAKAAEARWQTYEKAKTELFKDDNKCDLVDKALQVLNEQRANTGQQAYQCNYVFVIKIAEKLQELEQNANCQEAFDQLSNEFVLMLPFDPVEAVYLEQKAVKLAAEWTSTRTKYTHMNALVRQD